jgi:uroporphyrinogen-III synthase
MRVIVTRPAREAQAWVAALQHAGHAALALPLIEIAPAPDLDAVRAVWAQWGADSQRWQALMFVSVNAVEGLFAARPADAPLVPALQAEAWAPGPGTVRALQAAAWPSARIVAPSEDAPQFDSEALWARVGDRLGPHSRVLIVRGASALEGSGAVSHGVGRDWFARQVRAAGGQVDFLAAYQRRPPLWTDAEREAATRLAADAEAVWLFSSSEAVRHLRQLLPEQDRRAARALVTHERIAQAARDAGFGEVVVSRPALADVSQALTAYAQRAPR